MADSEANCQSVRRKRRKLNPLVPYQDPFNDDFEDELPELSISFSPPDHRRDGKTPQTPTTPSILVVSPTPSANASLHGKRGLRATEDALLPAPPPKRPRPTPLQLPVPRNDISTPLEPSLGVVHPRSSGVSVPAPTNVSAAAPALSGLDQPASRSKTDSPPEFTLPVPINAWENLLRHHTAKRYTVLPLRRSTTDKADTESVYLLRPLAKEQRPRVLDGGLYAGIAEGLASGQPVTFLFWPGLPVIDTGSTGIQTLRAKTEMAASSSAPTPAFSRLELKQFTTYLGQILGKRSAGHMTTIVGLSEALQCAYGAGVTKASQGESERQATSAFRQVGKQFKHVEDIRFMDLHEWKKELDLRYVELSLDTLSLDSRESQG